IGILVSAIYIIAHLFTDGGNLVVLFHLGTVSMLIYSIYLHRVGNHPFANYFLLFTINIAVYMFAASEPRATGTMVFFMANSVAAFAIFPYNQRLNAIFFSIFTYALFILACLGNVPFIPFRQYTEEMVLFNMVVNFSVALPATAMGVYLLIDLSHYNALQLEERNVQLNK